jgi:hypothetical protein
MNEEPLIPGLTERRRAALYRMLVALAPLAVFYGLLSEQEAALWITAAASVLGNVVAAVNTPRP